MRGHRQQTGGGREGGGGLQFAITETEAAVRAPTVSGPWESIATNTTPASGLIEYHETNPPADEAFYRSVTP